MQAQMRNKVKVNLFSSGILHDGFQQKGCTLTGEETERSKIRTEEHTKCSADGQISKGFCKCVGRERFYCMQRECFLKDLFDARHFSILASPALTCLWQDHNKNSTLFWRYYFLQPPEFAFSSPGVSPGQETTICFPFYGKGWILPSQVF